MFGGVSWCADCAVRLFSEPGDAAGIPDTRRCLCGTDSPLCETCETYHCAGCGCPGEYTTVRFAPLPCGCVEQRNRRVCRDRIGLRTRSTVTHYARPVSYCATHRPERVQRREMTDDERARYVQTGGRDTNRTGD